MDEWSGEEKWLLEKLSQVHMREMKHMRKVMWTPAVGIVVIGMVTAAIVITGHGGTHPGRIVQTHPIAVLASPTPVVDGPTCQPSNLSLSLTVAAPSAGTSFNWYVLTNTGSTTCYLSGIPRVDYTSNSSSGVTYTNTVQPATDVFPVARLSPGGTATFLFGNTACNFPAGASKTGSGSPYAALQIAVRLPGTKQELVYTESRASICVGQITTVWPVQNGYESIPGGETNAGDRTYPIITKVLPS